MSRVARRFLTHFVDPSTVHPAELCCLAEEPEHKNDAEDIADMKTRKHLPKRPIKALEATGV
jgi:hypothetical protein